jgi:hypothetical protein
MARVEENNLLLKKVQELSADNPSGEYKQIMEIHLAVIDILLMDISKSLAVLADKSEREEKE